MKVVVRLLGHDGELLDSHLFFYHRFFELADELRVRGWLGSAARCDAIAEAHYQAAPGDDDPSDAAAMAMPVPQPSLFTNAVSATSPTRKSSRDSGDPRTVAGALIGAPDRSA